MWFLRKNIFIRRTQWIDKVVTKWFECVFSVTSDLTTFRTQDVKKGDCWLYSQLIQRIYLWFQVFNRMPDFPYELGKLISSCSVQSSYDLCLEWYCLIYMGNWSSKMALFIKAGLSGWSFVWLSESFIFIYGLFKASFIEI